MRSLSGKRRTPAGITASPSITECPPAQLSEFEALLNRLERRGLITKAEVLAEIKQSLTVLPG